MTYNVYSVRDAKTTFATPFVDVNDDSARRGFAYAFSNATNMVSFSPADFSLYCIGMFDSDTGHLTDCLPRFICDGLSFARKEVLNEE